MTAILEDFSMFLFEDIADPRTSNWPLMTRPWYMIGILTTYLLLIYFVLPLYMSSRKPYILNRIIQGYNLFQVIACTLVIYETLASGFSIEYFGCKAIDYSQDKLALRIANLFWWVMILKIIELIETIFFTLRKKFNQVSPLHVYHHISTAVIAWISTKYGPGGMLLFPIFLNFFVHVIMYSYYFLSSLGPSMQKKIQWIKSKITIIQVVQLSLMFIHTLQLLKPTCKVHNSYIIIFLPTLFINIFLFIRFYRKTYIKKQK